LKETLSVIKINNTINVENTNVLLTIATQLK